MELVTVVLIVVLLLISVWLLRRLTSKLTLQGKSVKTLVVLGSGGHTTEMLSMMSALPDANFSNTTFLIADTDKMSENKLRSMYPSPSIVRTPRAREVGQSWLTSVLTTSVALLHAVSIVWSLKPDLVLANGPGTCVPIAYIAWVLKLLTVKECRIVFVESIARVHSLSLSGKLLYPIADKFLVQWEGLSKKYPRARHVGFVI
mmetsp:Transcript_21711/g.59504  ORF Transcript_21711/g.59504 Transcript_21711/m.59504 type:complete len:203 (-) Transcript_21711:81-689(-)